MIDINYNKILNIVLREGIWYEDPNRKGVKRLEIPSYTFRHEFKDGFPAISTKKLAWKSIVTELLWFLKGDTNIKYLIDNNCNIWNKDAYSYYLKQCEILKLPKDQEESIENFIKLIKNPGDINKLFEFYNSDYKIGDLGKVYGHYWRNFDGVDQIAELINDMINKPMSSELIVSARNPSHKEMQALPCCHYGFQIIMKPLHLGERFSMLTYEDKKNFKDILSKSLIENTHPGGQEIRHKYCDDCGIPQYGFELHWNQRSCDLFLGIPFNIASYALLALILEKITGHKALGIQCDGKKIHLYDNSIDAAKEQLSRPCSKELVTVKFDNLSYKKGTKFKDIDMFLDELIPEYFELKNYNPQLAIKVEMLERK